MLNADTRVCCATRHAAPARPHQWVVADIQPLKQPIAVLSHLIAHRQHGATTATPHTQIPPRIKVSTPVMCAPHKCALITSGSSGCQQEGRSPTSVGLHKNSSGHQNHTHDWSNHQTAHLQSWKPFRFLVALFACFVGPVPEEVPVQCIGCCQDIWFLAYRTTIQSHPTASGAGRVVHARAGADQVSVAERIVDAAHAWPELGIEQP